MNKRVLGLAISSVLFSSHVLASPVYRVNSEVAQGNAGNGLSVVLSPAQVVSINFSRLGEKIVSITPGDRSRFVFNASGSVVSLKRIKPLNFEGEYSGGGDTTLIITTIGPSGQRVYPVTVRFANNRPGYSVIEIAPDGGEVETFPARTPQRKIPLTTVQAPPPYRPTVPAEVAILPIDDPVKVLAQVGKDVTLPPPPKVEDSPKAELKPEPKSEPIVIPPPKKEPIANLFKAAMRQESAKSPPTAEIKPEAKSKVEGPSELTPSQRALAEISAYKKPEIKKSEDPSLESPAPKISEVQTFEVPKLTNHQQANALVLGMMRSKASRYEVRRGQDAIWVLRKGKGLSEAARRSGLSVSRLQKFIEIGSRKDV
jgi:hypothetical protein